MKYLTYILTAILFLLVVACQQQPSETMEEASQDTAVEHAEKHTDPNYVCPMHSQIVRGEPGSCPICGMDLVKIESDDESDSDDNEYPAVRIKPHVAQNMGLRTTQVKRGFLDKKITTVGQLEYNEDSLAHIHSRGEGWVEKLNIRSAGDVVKKGEVLLEYYSPEILAAQEEYIIALQTQSGLASVAKERLSLLGVPNSTIRLIRRKGKARRSIPIIAPTDGLVAKIGIRDGMFIKPAMELYTLAKLSDVWVQVDVFEDQLNWVKSGRPAKITVAALPGRSWKGEIDYVYPELDPVSRTLKVRLRFPNKDGALKPNMFANVFIDGGHDHDVLSVPREAVIFSGDVARVIKQVEDNRFRPVEVITGIQTEGKIEIINGIEEGDLIVVSGQFLIDSESNLQASFRRFRAE